MYVRVLPPASEKPPAQDGFAPMNRGQAVRVVTRVDGLVCPRRRPEKSDERAQRVQPGRVLLGRSGRPDTDAAAAFYGDLLGWNRERYEPDPEGYWYFTSLE
jgi:hypothetical protein